MTGLCVRLTSGETPFKTSVKIMTEVETAASTKLNRAPYRYCAADHFRTRIHISYDGTDFSGWQRQTTLPSIQGTLEAALSKIYNRPMSVMGASRTDAGVHANQQVAHFDAPRDPEAFDLRYAIQCLCPDSIVVEEMFAAPADFHAIATVTDKIYKYRIFNRWVPSALSARYTYWIRADLDLEFLNAASQYLIGTQDFKSFQSSGTIVQTTVRTIREASWARADEHVLEFTLRGDGFLKQMVRNIVGTLIDMNVDRQNPEAVRDLIALRDRRKAGPTAEPQGLFLHRVNYPEAVDNSCRKL